MFSKSGTDNLYLIVLLIGQLNDHNPISLRIYPHYKNSESSKCAHL